MDIKNKKQLIIILLFTIGLLNISVINTQAATASATLFISPASYTYYLGKTFIASVYINSPTEAMNAFNGVISFPKEKLEVVSLSKNSSIVSMWIPEPSFSNSEGTINLQGVILHPGFIGNNGLIISITFKGKGAGTANLNFSLGSVLANDGKGTNLLTTLNGAAYTLLLNQDGSGIDLTEPETPAAETTQPTIPEIVRPQVPSKPTISSPTHPDQSAWYNNPNPTLQWRLASDVTDLSLKLDQRSNTNPGDFSVGKITGYNYTKLKDGVWYFHLRFKNNQGWGETAHYRLQIDTQKPEDFKITLAERADLTNPQIELIFNATDTTSGIDFYEISLFGQEKQDWQPTGQENFIVTLPTGKHYLVAKAIDFAGNYLMDSMEFSVEPLAAPEIIDYTHQLLTTERFSAKGLTYPSVQVTLWTQKASAAPESRTFISNPDGTFNFVAARKLTKGQYNFWLEVTDQRGAKSLPTEQLPIKVSSVKLFNFSAWPLDFLIIFILLQITIGVLAWLLLKKKDIKTSDHNLPPLATPPSSSANTQPPNEPAAEEKIDNSSETNFN